MGGTPVYRDKVDEEGLAGQDKRMIQTVYMNRVDEGMQRGRISRWEGRCTRIRWTKKIWSGRISG
jgi:hypothetical protein